MEFIFNFTNIGKNISGLGRYSKSILETLECLKFNDVNIKVYLNRAVIKDFNHIKNLQLLSAPSYVSPDFAFKGHLARLLWSNYLAVKGKKAVIFNPSQLEGVFIKKNKAITVIHDLIPLIFKKGKLYYYFKYFLPYILNNSLKIITVSEHTKKLLLEHYKNISERKVHVIYNGISKKFNFLNLTKEPFILYVGRFEELKNIKNLLKAFSLLVKKYKLDYELVLIGSGELNVGNLDEVVKRKIKVFKNISDEKLVEFYNKASLFVFPSFYEGFGFPPLEAMACGTPVVVSNVSSLPEVCGDAGYYIDPYNVEDITRGMYEVLKDETLQKELVQKGFKRVKQFSWEKTVKDILEIMKEVANL